MKTDTSEKIVKYIKSEGQVTAKDLVDYLGISRQALFKHIPKLLKNNSISKKGKPPKVFYFILGKKQGLKYDIDSKIKEFIDKNYLIITPTGERLEGMNGFVFWAEKTSQNVKRAAEDYVKILKKYNRQKEEGFIDGMSKMRNTFDYVYLDKLCYLDFYSIERFGKTKLGQLLLYAKQSQDKKLIKEIVEIVKSKISLIINKYKIDGVVFVPPTVKREIQFMKELEKQLDLKIRTIKITKIKTEVIVPQKTLSKLKDRIDNAALTFVVEGKNQYKNILMIDDAVGSGATLNEIAKQIKERKICTNKIIGLSITGSFKGFDVISEV